MTVPRYEAPADPASSGLTGAVEDKAWRLLPGQSADVVGVQTVRPRSAIALAPGRRLVENPVAGEMNDVVVGRGEPFGEPRVAWRLLARGCRRGLRMASGGPRSRRVPRSRPSCPGRSAVGFITARMRTSRSCVAGSRPGFGMKRVLTSRPSGASSAKTPPRERMTSQGRLRMVSSTESRIAVGVIPRRYSSPSRPRKTRCNIVPSSVARRRARSGVSASRRLHACRSRVASMMDCWLAASRRAFRCHVIPVPFFVDRHEELKIF